MYSVNSASSCSIINFDIKSCQEMSKTFEREGRPSIPVWARAKEREIGQSDKISPLILI